MVSIKCYLERENDKIFKLHVNKYGNRIFSRDKIFISYTKIVFNT